MVKLKKPDPRDEANIPHLDWLAGLLDGSGALEPKKISMHTHSSEVIDAVKRRFGGDFILNEKHANKVRHLLQAVNGRLVTGARLHQFELACRPKSKTGNL